MYCLDYSKTKYCNLIGQLQVSKLHRKPVLIYWETFNNFYYTLKYASIIIK